jgi:hypothetical protein
LSGEIEDIKDIVDNLSDKVLKQNEQLSTLQLLTKKCDLFSTLESKYECLQLDMRNNCKKIDDIHNRSDPRRIHDSIDDILRMVRKNEEKIKDMETKITSINSKMKKIIKYLNFD